MQTLEFIYLEKKKTLIWLYFKVKQTLHTDNSVVYRLHCCNPLS